MFAFKKFEVLRNSPSSIAFAMVLNLMASNSSIATTGSDDTGGGGSPYNTMSSDAFFRMNREALENIRRSGNGRGFRTTDGFSGFLTTDILDAILIDRKYVQSLFSRIAEISNENERLDFITRELKDAELYLEGVKTQRSSIGHPDANNGLIELFFPENTDIFRASATGIKVEKLDARLFRLERLYGEVVSMLKAWALVPSAGPR